MNLNQSQQNKKAQKFATVFRCIKCGGVTPYHDDLLIYTCPTCGGNLTIDYDYDRLARSWDRDTLAANTSDRTIWRYAPLLPVAGRIDNLSIGWSPIVQAPRLSRTLGLKHDLLIKDEGRNPSASFKDRASAIALVKAQELGYQMVTGASTGNAASATAVLSAAMGMKARIFVPKTAPQAKIAQLVTFGAQVLAVDGTYDNAFDLCLAATARFGWYNRNTGFNPFTREGKKTASFEICEQLGFQVPDLVVVPVGDGNIISGIWKGFYEFYKLGFIDRLPRLLAAQATGSSAVVDALNGDGKIREVSGNTVADSISVSIPRDGLAAVQAVKESKGFGVLVNDDQILAAIGEIARNSGVFCEPAAATSYACLQQAVTDNKVDPDWKVLMLATGNGLKDIASAMKTAQMPKIISPDPAILEQMFAQEQP